MRNGRLNLAFTALSVGISIAHVNTGSNDDIIRKTVECTIPHVVEEVPQEIPANTTLVRELIAPVQAECNKLKEANKAAVVKAERERLEAERLAKLEKERIARIEAARVRQQISRAVTYSTYEKDLMARLVHAEAKGEPYAGKVAVAEVILNRIDSDKFPDSVRAVVYQRGQFSPVSDGSINREADSDSRRAVEEAIATPKSKRVNSLFFYNPRTATSRWLDGLRTTSVIGNHVFKM